MASLPFRLPTRGGAPSPVDKTEEKDLQASLKHFNRILAKSASLGDYVSSIQHAHTCLLLHNRLVDIHWERQRDKAQRARQRGNSGRVAHHLLKLQQIEARRLAVPALVHPSYQQLSDRQDVSLAAEGSSALSPTSAPMALPPDRISPQHHSTQQHSPHHQQQMHHPMPQPPQQQQPAPKRDSTDNVLYLLQHQMAAISTQQYPSDPHQQLHQQQPTDTQDIIRRLQHQATHSSTAHRQSSQPASQPNSPQHTHPPTPHSSTHHPTDQHAAHSHTPRQPRLPPPAYQPRSPQPQSPSSQQSSPHSGVGVGLGSGPYGARETAVVGSEGAEGTEGKEGKEEKRYQAVERAGQGERETANGPVVMLQADEEEGGEEREGEVRTNTGYETRKETMRQTEGGKEEKRDMGDYQRETGSSNGPVLMLNAR